jgi:hypothetical protein
MANTIHYKNLMQFIENSIGTKLFRNHFRTTKKGKIKDVTEDGKSSCSFYAGVILYLSGLIPKPHNMVKNTITELEENGWYEVSKPRRGAVIIWEATKESRGSLHIGFCLNKNEAISNLSSSRCPRKHHITFGIFNKKPVRKIDRIYWNNLLGKYS